MHLVAGEAVVTNVDGDLAIDVATAAVSAERVKGRELRVDPGSGISTDVPVTVTRRERDRLIGRIGDGRGRIKIEAGSGGVRLLRQ